VSELSPKRLSEYFPKRVSDFAEIRTSEYQLAGGGGDVLW
jgi:hypothetical protein